VLVVVVTVRGVTVPVVRVVDMVAVGDGLVPAAGPVYVLVTGVGQVRQRVLVVVPVVRGVGVPFVDVVDMPLALGTGVPAAGSVLVVGVGVNLMTGSDHGSSLL
jgi:hypothetical protein